MSAVYCCSNTGWFCILFFFTDKMKYKYDMKKVKNVISKT